ncbi:MAG: 7TM domain-containing protein [Patescibacteria group bacterium]
MKKVTALILIAIACLGFFNFANAQQNIAANLPDQKEIPQVPLTAVSGGDRNVVVERQIFFSAAGSSAPKGAPVEYIWNFGDGNRATGQEVIHTYRNPGIYRASLTVQDRQSGQQSTDEFIVSVDKDLIILISDYSVDNQRLEELARQASSQGILIINIKNEKKDLDIVVENELSQKIIESKENIKQAKNIVVLTEGNIGLNALINAAQTLSATTITGGRTALADYGFSNKVIIVVNDKFSGAARLAQSLFNLIEPQFILLAEKEGLNSAVSFINLDSLLNNYGEGGVQYQLIGLHTQREIGQLKPWNFLAYGISYMVNRGVPLNSIYLLLILPIIATILSFTRQFIGIKAFGIYTPTIIALSFLGTGIVYGLLIFALILIIASVGRVLARKLGLLYLPRMALILIIVSLATMTLFAIGALMKDTSLMTLSVFPILIMIVLSEKFVSAQIERGMRPAILLTIETLILSSFCYWLASLQTMKSLLLGYPEIILLCIVINIFLGKWAGLRLTEYFRFRKVIKHAADSKKK